MFAKINYVFRYYPRKYYRDIEGQSLGIKIMSMKKIKLTVVFIMLLQLAFAGGILTNYNQSAQYTRMLSRNASLGLDGVFYNPAGLVKLEDGWHFYFSSQTIWQSREITSDFPLLNNGYYKGETFAPIFPDFYATYKKDKWAFSFGITPVAGGGTAEFTRGLPTFEIPISQTKTLLADLGVQGYDVDLYFKGNSVFWGIQLGATYAINDKFSVYGGVRWIPAKNVYEGYIKNIQLNVGGSYVPAPAFLSQASVTVNGYSQVAYSSANNLQQLMDMGAGSMTLAQLETKGYITSVERAQIEGGLQMLNVDQNMIDAMNVGEIQGTFTVVGDQLSEKSQQLSQNATKMKDRIVNTEQTGNSFIPIIGINYSPNDDWNFALKYEMKTFLTLDNKPKADNSYDLWKDEVNSDVPAIFTAGIGYSGLDWLEAQLSYNLYFDNRVDWGNNVNDVAVWGTVDPLKIRHRETDNNYYELGLGLQFNLSEKFAVSVGGLRSKTGVTDSWQNDLSYSNSSYTLGGGLMWGITDKIKLDLGVSNTFYQDDEKVPFSYPGYPDMNGNPITSYSNTYAKSAFVVSAGLSISIF